MERPGIMGPIPTGVDYTPEYTKEQLIDFGVESPIDSGAEFYKAWADTLGFGVEYRKNIRDLSFEREVMKIKTEKRLAAEALAKKKQDEADERARQTLELQRSQTDMLRWQQGGTNIPTSISTPLNYWDTWLQRNRGY